ncbi:MAG TPA: peptidase C69 [Cyanobacteria bacterium UBA11149]|nr:peptidase C69 [Cyanobacteria bacterium UBA11367]HBE56970.1 peptidase C69 [Cyanobacteria bacterium UBA11366]HBK65078.1 peptidase C69 [Cyanobacteria bacterium UBA11166]HBR72220.1 peptidase C69 [Cyanobacteria bacterium UBA11159]HBS72461.1 peptidase C69 [Cyanobacteria bacterium UBA11153]HBW91661.1 peptidase C69 [Cyanobacteria bacterium UBA11149]HCA95643.1 peptidase C69 [Cyanobacteria bacterium UBA9226]
MIVKNSKYMEPEQLIELAEKSGANASEVYQSKSFSKPVFFEANRLKQLESSQAEGVALRLWRENRPGLAVAYGEVEPQMLVDKALAMTKLNEPEIVELAEARSEVYPDLGEKVSVEELVKMGKNAIATIREEFPEVLCMGQWDCEEETTRLVNSQGLDCYHTDTTLSCFLSGEWVRGDDFLSVSDGQTQRRSLANEKVVQQILQRLEWAKENVAPPLGKVPVLLTAKAADLLWDTVQAALNGKQVLEGSSPWNNRLSQMVTSDTLTLSQKPDTGPYSCPFDDEGTPTRPLLLIREGQLQQFYCDRTTGRLIGMGTTGNGFRPGMGSYPTPGLVNLLIQPGKGSLHSLITQLDDGLIVDQILGGGAGISGDFSVNVDLGYRVRKGEIIGRVKDTMIAGNVYNILKQVVSLGEDADWNGPCYTPSLIIEGISVTGEE